MSTACPAADISEFASSPQKRPSIRTVSTLATEHAVGGGGKHVVSIRRYCFRSDFPLPEFMCDKSDINRIDIWKAILGHVLGFVIP